MPAAPAAGGWESLLPLVGAGGEPVDLARTLRSHGVAALPPASVERDGSALTTTVALPAGLPRTVVVRAGGANTAVITAGGPAPDGATALAIVGRVAHILRLDEDLSAFYALVAGDPDLSWASAGAGRMVRSATVFEEIVKTICTTNCAWSATERMVGALVSQLGEAGWSGARTFPTPAAMAAAPESFYRDVVRAGYRGRYLRGLAGRVAGGELDPEAWGRASRDQLSDDELAAQLLALPGVGPYAAAHVLLLLGRYSPLILDSWTRPTYARLVGASRPDVEARASRPDVEARASRTDVEARASRPDVEARASRTDIDAEIRARFAPYGPWAGLAFWLFLTRSWL